MTHSPGCPRQPVLFVCRKVYQSNKRFGLIESNSGPEDMSVLVTFDFLTNNPLRSFCLVSSDIGRLCSKQSTSSFETPAISASSCCVNCKEMRKLAALKPIDDPRTKLRTVVMVFSLSDKDTSSTLNEQAYAYPLQMGTLTQKMRNVVAAERSKKLAPSSKPEMALMVIRPV